MTYDNLPARYPKRPDPDLHLRVARIRIQVALLAVKEALEAPRFRTAQVELALENLEHAKRALRRG